MEKGLLALHRTATLQPRKIERPGFFLLDHNGQTWIYRLVWGPTEVRFWRNCNFPTGGAIWPPPLWLGLKQVTSCYIWLYLAIPDLSMASSIKYQVIAIWNFFIIFFHSSNFEEAQAPKNFEKRYIIKILVSTFNSLWIEYIVSPWP